jgi:hypothetical protein
MTTSTKPPPRFLPTLTEVVEPTPAVAQSPVLLQTHGSGFEASPEVALAQMLSRLQEPMAQQIRSLVTDMLEHQSQQMQNRIEQEVMQQMRIWLQDAVRNDSLGDATGERQL